MQVYPLKFEPILREKVWGGTRLNHKLEAMPPTVVIGESWELSNMEGFESVIKNGYFKGKNLMEVLKEYRTDFLGKDLLDFPLLLKYIDAATALSVQVHPDDVFAKSHENTSGKTELWYIVDAAPKAEIYIGFKKDYTDTEIKEALKTGIITDLLKVYYPKKGDVFYIPAGTIHAIGAGIYIMELQQASDATYRIYDWDRKDRTLHLGKALQVLNLKGNICHQVQYSLQKNTFTLVKESPYFRLEICDLKGEISLDTAHSFAIIIPLEKELKITYQENEQTIVAPEEIVLLPAELGKYKLTSEDTPVLKITL